VLIVAFAIAAAFPAALSSPKILVKLFKPCETTLVFSA
jgi:hypothetical protein